MHISRSFPDMQLNRTVCLKLKKNQFICNSVTLWSAGGNDLETLVKALLYCYIEMLYILEVSNFFYGALCREEYETVTVKVY